MKHDKMIIRGVLWTESKDLGDGEHFEIINKRGESHTFKRSECFDNYEKFQAVFGEEAMAEIIKEVPIEYFYNERQIRKREKYEDFSLIEKINDKEFLAIDFYTVDGGRGYKNAKLIKSSYVGAPEQGHYQTQLDSIFIQTYLKQNYPLFEKFGDIKVYSQKRDEDINFYIGNQAKDSKNFTLFINLEALVKGDIDTVIKDFGMYSKKDFIPSIEDEDFYKAIKSVVLGADENDIKSQYATLIKKTEEKRNNKDYEALNQEQQNIIKKIDEFFNKLNGTGELTKESMVKLNETLSKIEGK